MEKDNVLVRDEKGFFLKMFKKELTNEFKFTEKSFEYNDQTEIKDFDRFVFVVYNKTELIEFLKIDKKGSNVLVCLFDEQLYGNLSFLEEINNLILLDGYKTKKEIIKDLKLYLKNTVEVKKQSSKCFIPNSQTNQTQFHNFFNSVLLFI